jgi:hypothetical protein
MHISVRQTLNETRTLDKLKKTKSTKGKDNARKASKPSSKSKRKQPPTKVPEIKMPKSTFDVWLAKQARSVDRSGGSEKVVQRGSTGTLVVKDTFEAWIEKQKPREESATEKAPGNPVPDTFEKWMHHQVVLHEKGASAAEQQPSA